MIIATAHFALQCKYKVFTLGVDRNQQGAAQLYFDWDESNVGHLARHQVLPEEAEQVIRNEPFEIEEDFRGEPRCQFLGATDAGRILIVVAAVSEESVRVVTAWPAKRRLRAFWLTHTKGRQYGEKGE